MAPVFAWGALLSFGSYDSLNVIIYQMLNNINFILLDLFEFFSRKVFFFVVFCRAGFD